MLETAHFSMLYCTHIIVVLCFIVLYRKEKKELDRREERRENKWKRR
jgi:amino acid transporter